MSSGQVARRYARAWISAASDKKCLDVMAADCAALLAMIGSTPELQAFVRSPLIGLKAQRDCMHAIAEKAGFHAVSISFIDSVVQARRLGLMADILQIAQNMVEEASGVRRAQVVSASVLDEPRVAEIRKQLSAKLGGDVAVETKVDSSIIGGLVLKVGSKMIDNSVKTKLARMARKLQGNAA